MKFAGVVLCQECQDRVDKATGGRVQFHAAQHSDAGQLVADLDALRLAFADQRDRLAATEIRVGIRATAHTVTIPVEIHARGKHCWRCQFLDGSSCLLPGAVFGSEFSQALTVGDGDYLRTPRCLALVPVEPDSGDE